MGRILTIGHGSRTPLEFIEELQREQVQFVADVRSVPYSRVQREFSREQLKGVLLSKGIRYVFMGDQLGGRPKDDDCYTDGRADYTKIAGKDFFKSGISRLLQAYGQGLTVCLLCSEAKPSQCHRAKLIGSALNTHSIQVEHLLRGGGKCSQDDVLRELTSGQGALFGDAFMSRHTYR